MKVILFGATGMVGQGVFESRDIVALSQVTVEVFIHER